MTERSPGGNTSCENVELEISKLSTVYQVSAEINDGSCEFTTSIPEIATMGLPEPDTIEIGATLWDKLAN